jgi:membrane-bound transcription factor site-1 protease
LTQSFNCFDALNYGALLVIDPEDFFSRSEIEKVLYDVKQSSMGLVVVADWYNDKAMLKMKHYASENDFGFYMAGSNVPALNALLKRFGIQFG